ncbi:MAG: dethiobiotin synthase [Deltaproteobacteria bacterium]|nr:MAG: dethiobiotin synthase [Deltaproteobacteria bacterium]
MVVLPEIAPTRGVFVTGTDTGVGKTVIAAGLTAALRELGQAAVYFKPIQSGARATEDGLIPDDALFAQQMANLEEPLAMLTPISLKLPLAPAVAAAQAGVRIDLNRIAAAFNDLARRYDFLVVEGAGGLYVPLIDTDFLVLDLACWLNLPLVVVARPGLGTINHTTLSVKAALSAGLEVAGIIINQYPEHPGLAARTNPEIIAALTGKPILGLVHVIIDLDTTSGRKSLLAALQTIVCRSDWPRP